MLPKLHPSSRYELIAKIAAGGMATVYLGALKGPFGFEQLVAIKQLHAHLLDDDVVRESLLMEARSASRIRHANVVDVRDIEVFDDVVQLVMTYVEGASLAKLLGAAAKRDEKIPPAIAIRIVLDACAGLHAAHELLDDLGKPLGLIHRDVSPQNVLVGVDGIARITDFGVARDESSDRNHSTTGALKGKFAYMAPEYVRGERLDRRADVFALAVLLWEALSGARLFKGKNDAETIKRITDMAAPQIGSLVPELGDGIDSIFEIALAKTPETRFLSAQAFGSAVETLAKKAKLIATAAEVGQYVRDTAHEDLARLEHLRQSTARNAKNKDSISEPPPTVRAEALASSIPKAAAVPTLATEIQAHDESQVSTQIYRPNADPNTPEAGSVAPAQFIGQAEPIESPAPSREVLSGPVPSSSSSRLALYVGPQGAPHIASAPKSMRDLVFRQIPNGPTSDPQPMSSRSLESLADENSSAGAMTAAGLLVQRDSISIVLAARDKLISARISRLRWMVAAFLVFVLSGVGVMRLVGPGRWTANSSSDAKK